MDPSLLQGGLSNLKQTVTRVRQRDGTVSEEQRQPDGSVKVLSTNHDVLPAFYDDAAKGFSTLDIMQYDEGEERWVRCVPPPSQSKSYSKTLTCVTYNVWFSEKNQKIRAQGLLAIVKTQQPDIICFQEVTPTFISAVTMASWIQETYFLSDATGRSCSPYGVMMLVRKDCPNLPLERFTIHQLPTNMGRRVVVATFTNGLKIATAHLESLSNQEMRLAQIRQIAPLLNATQCSTGLFMGDTNFPHMCAESELIKKDFPEFSDVWADIHCKSSGDPLSKTPNISTMIDEPHVGRIDKVFLVKNKKAGGSGDIKLSAKEIGLLGTNQFITAEGISSHASDHAGLVARFKVGKI
eukprot:Colp12_sorted_trinity150504_noHs@35786